MESLKLTLVGMHYYDEEAFVAHVNECTSNSQPVRIWLRRNKNFEYGIDVIAFFDNGYYKVGSVATNIGLVASGTANGKDIARLMDEDFVYSTFFRPRDLLKVQGYGGRHVLNLFEGSMPFSSEVVEQMRKRMERELKVTIKGFRSLNELTHRYSRIKAISEEKIRETEAKTIVKQIREEMESDTTHRYQGGSVTTTDGIVTSNQIRITDDSLNKLNGLIYTTTTTDSTLTLNTQPAGKKGKTMKNMNSMFNKFGKDFAYPTSNFALSMFGGLAVKVNGNFVSYDSKKGEAMDVMDFVIDGFEDFIMIMPVQELKDGDVFVQDGKVYQMIDAAAREAYNYNDNAIDTLVTKSNIMGFKMYAKVINFASNMMGAGEKSDNMFGNPMFMMMMMKDNDGDMGEMMKLMVMSQMFQGGFKIG